MMPMRNTESVKPDLISSDFEMKNGVPGLFKSGEMDGFPLDLQHELEQFAGVSVHDYASEGRALVEQTMSEQRLVSVF